MIDDPVMPFVSGAFRVKFATEAWERAEAMTLRREVFCVEQALFAGDDRDATDDVARCIVAVAPMAGMPHRVVGTVRIHEAELGVWYGSRLAVERAHRRVGALGAALIRVAVSSAHARGCHRFLAHVQIQNAKMFHMLHWETLDEVLLHGRPHHLMRADLDHYPPLADAEDGILALTRRVA